MTQTSTAEYTAKDIQVLEGLEAVRVPPGMYIGSTDQRGLHHLIYEVLDNAVDEAMAGFCSRVEMDLGADGTITVSDDSTYIANFLKEMGSFYEPDAKYWGLSNDPINQEDTLHNEMYFDQFLAWFGASLVSGQFQNISEDYFLDTKHKLIDQRFLGIVESVPTPTFKYDIAQIELIFNSF